MKKTSDRLNFNDDQKIPSKLLPSQHTHYWWVANQYEKLPQESGFCIRPDSSCRWPDDFNIYPLRYDGFEKIDPALMPHDHFFKIGPDSDWISSERISALYKWVELYGLLRGNPGHTLPTMVLKAIEWPDRFKPAKNDSFMYLVPKEIKPGQSIEDGVEAIKVKPQTTSNPNRMYNYDYSETTVQTHDRKVPFVQEVYGEYIGYDTPGPICNIRNKFYSFYKDFYDGIDENYTDEHNRLDPDNNSEIDVQVTVTSSGEQQYKFKSLNNAIYFYASQDIKQNKIGWCLECGSFYRTSKKHKRRFCPDGTVGEKRCRQRAHERKHRQKKSWESYLEDNAPSIIDNWPQTKKGFLEHPYDVINDSSVSTNEHEDKHIRRWAKRSKKYSSRTRPDPWLHKLTVLQKI